MWGDWAENGGGSEISKGSNSLAFPCTGSEAVVIGEVHENVTLRCGNVSGRRAVVTWYRNDSEPVFILSSRSSLLPAMPRFSLANGSSLHISALSMRDEGNYTCWEGLHESRWFRVSLQMASKWAGRGLGTAGGALGALHQRNALVSMAWVSFWVLPPAS